MMSDCIECWATPCECGHWYQDYTVTRLEKMRNLFQRLINERGVGVSTGLRDRMGREIKSGQIIHWTDGGDDLTLAERIAKRWDRIAEVSMKGILPHFTVIDSPMPDCRPDGKYGVMVFNYGSFIYKDTENYLTIVAESKDEYFQKFKNAGECMGWVLTESERTKNENG